MAKVATAVAPATGNAVAVQKKRELTTREGSGGIISIPPLGAVAVYSDMVDDGETGLENVTSKERRIPIVRILDPKSPQVKPAERGGVPGAKPGDIFNTSTSQVYDGKRGLYLIGCHRTCKYVNYVRRNTDGTGGGFAGLYEPEDLLVKKRIQETIAKYGDTFRKLENGFVPDLLPSGDKNPNAGKPLDLVETWYVGGLLIVPNEDGSFPGEYGEVFPALVPFSSTNIKAYNAFIDRNSNIRYIVKRRDGSLSPIKPTLWSHVWKLNTFFFERGAQSWYKWQLSLAEKDGDGAELNHAMSRLPISAPLYQEAVAVRKAIMEGNVEIDYAKQADDATGTAEALPQHDDKDITY